jgi:hypothetical protein
MSKYFHPLTSTVALQLASNLRPDDRREIQEGHGHNPSQVLFAAAFTDYSLAFKLPNGEWGGAFGVGPDNGIWMLCTPEIETYPLTFARECKRFVESRMEKYLWNIADKRNTVHLKLLKFLGFKFLREIKHGPNNLTFIEFCRVRTYTTTNCSR